MQLSLSALLELRDDSFVTSEYRGTSIWKGGEGGMGDWALFVEGYLSFVEMEYQGGMPSMVYENSARSRTVGWLGKDGTSEFREHLVKAGRDAQRSLSKQNASQWHGELKTFAMQHLGQDPCGRAGSTGSSLGMAAALWAWNLECVDAFPGRQAEESSFVTLRGLREYCCVC